MERLLAAALIAWSPLSLLIRKIFNRHNRRRVYKIIANSISQLIDGKPSHRAQ